jgi:RNA polymerase primary sigma factor
MERGAMEHQNLIRKIVAEGQKNGYLTYSELNTMLPEDLASSPEQLDEIIGVLDERGIELIDDGDSSGLDLVAAGEDPLDIEDRKAQQAKEFESGQEEGPVSDPEGGRTTRPAVALLPEMVERIDDPVRMYLTQMGEIPLLTRDEEISLARKIELTRKQFRKLVLVSGFGTAEAISILKDVVAGELAFDRTIKVNQQDPDVGKSDLNYRLPGVIRQPPPGRGRSRRSTATAACPSWT